MYLEDYTVGRVFTLGPVGVSEDEIIEFARRYDPQPIHVDAEFAASGPFGGLIASGWHTCALTMRMLVDGYFSSFSSLGSPGIDEVRWPAPVRGGDELRTTVTVLENRLSASKPDRGIVRSRVETANQDGTLVCVMTAANLMRART